MNDREMTSPKVYQPILLRILHSGASGLTLLAVISGFLVYNTFDKRWGQLPISSILTIQDIHGTIAVAFLLFLPFFALYSFHVGSRRLVQDQSLTQLKQVGKPIWWISLHRLANTLMLLSVTIAAITGRMMKEQWLPAGELNQPWYLAHLGSWVGVLISLGLHVLMGVKVGGVPLLLSIVNLKMQDQDRPKAWLKGFTVLPSSLLLKIVEAIVMGGILLAFILPAFNS